MLVRVGSLRGSRTSLLEVDLGKLRKTYVSFDETSQIGKWSFFGLKAWPSGANLQLVWVVGDRRYLNSKRLGRRGPDWGCREPKRGGDDRRGSDLEMRTFGGQTDAISDR